MRLFPLRKADLRGAEAACQAEGGRLVEVGDVRKQRELERLVEGSRAAFPTVFGDLGDFWMGGTWDGRARSWRWKGSGRDLGGFDKWQNNVKSAQKYERYIQF